MIQQFHCYMYAPKNLKQGFKLYLYTSVHSSIIQNSQKVETTQMSINRWMAYFVYH